MSDLISRAALLKTLDDHIARYDNTPIIIATLKAAKRDVEQAQSIDAEPVVRCRDCKHWGKHDDVEVPGETDFVKGCEWAFWMVGESGYCVYGEKGVNNAGD